MLSFNHLGNLGRLANQMFQYASLKGIARNRGFDFCIPPKNVFGQQDPMVRLDLNLYDVFDIENKNQIGLVPNQATYESSHTFDEVIFNQIPDGRDLIGYFQTEKYFKHIEDEIRDDFAFKRELLIPCLEFRDSLGSSAIALHVRRGDYVNNPNHPVQTLDYYSRALDNLPDDRSVLIFTDDENWCNQQELFSGDRFMISQNSSVDADLCLMSLCSYHVIANSSFSWWGAWLANSEKIIAPKNWFGGECINKDVRDMAFGNWIWL